MVAQRTCEIPGCGKPHLAKGLCKAHYMKKRRHGTPLPPPPPVIECLAEWCEATSVTATMVKGRCPTHYRRWRDTGTMHKRVAATRMERFWAKIEHRPGSTCWWWTGALNGEGYGGFGVAASTSGKAHRYAYEMMVGPIPDGLVIDHLCRNPSCVNPSHLEPVTNAENHRRGLRGDLFVPATECQKGHALTEDNVYRFPSRKAPVCSTCWDEWASRSKANMRARCATR